MLHARMLTTAQLLPSPSHTILHAPTYPPSFSFSSAYAAIIVAALLIK